MNWTDITIEMPKESMRVKWLCDDGIEDVGFYNHDIKEFVTIDPKSENPITHWIPL